MYEACMKHAAAEWQLSESDSTTQLPLINNTASSLGKHPECTAAPLAAFTAGARRCDRRENEKLDFTLMD